MIGFRWIAVGLVAFGCGGKTDDEGQEPDSTGSPSDSSGSGAAAGDGEDGAWDAAAPLGKCGQGFDYSDAKGRHCNWMVAGVCYEDKLDACACACPSNVSTSSCYSGWPVEDGKVLVYCY